MVRRGFARWTLNGASWPNTRQLLTTETLQQLEIDFIADDPGPSLLHCHHQDHQDEGSMGLVMCL